MKCLGNKLGVGCWGVGQTEGHLDELVLTEEREECCLLSVCTLDRDHVEGPGTIKS